MIGIEKFEDIKLTDKFIPILICSSDKRDNSSLRYLNNQEVVLNATEGLKPDDMAFDHDISWKEFILENQNELTIPFKAFQLYSLSTYRLMRCAFGRRFFIQSAGFGIIRSDFRIPEYNITFKGGNIVNHRRYIANGLDGFNDLNHLLELNSNNQDILFIGSREYIKQFIELTNNLSCRKIIFYKGNFNLRPYRNLNQQFVFVKYEPETSSNYTWHYELADRLAEAEIIQRL
jgi:hypothetical protein